jgi:hypothetical protein
MTTILPHNGPDSPKPAPPIVVVDQPVMIDQAALDTALECPALTDAVVQEMLCRAASYQENPEGAIAWAELKAHLRGSVH